MPRGGARPNSGPRAAVLPFRDWCRKVVRDPKVQKAMQDHALANPEFALKVAEHGFGKPAQSVDITSGEQPLSMTLNFRVLPGVTADAE